MKLVSLAQFERSRGLVRHSHSGVSVRVCSESHVIGFRARALTIASLQQRTSIDGYFRPAVIACSSAVVYSVPNLGFRICRLCRHSSKDLSQYWEYCEKRVVSLLVGCRARVSGSVLSGAIFAQNTEVLNHGS